MSLIKALFSGLFIKKYNSFDFPVLKEQYSERIRKNIFKLTSLFLAVGLYLYGFKEFFVLEEIGIKEVEFNQFMVIFTSIVFIGLIIHSLFRLLLYKEFMKDESLKEEEKTYPKKMKTFYIVKTILLTVFLIGIIIGVR